MNKVGAFVVVFLLTLSIFPLAFAAENSTNQTSSPSTSSEDLSNSEKIEEGFECLEDKVGDCSSLTNQEIALTIMATPKDSTFDSCVEELKNRQSNNNWGNVRDTALAVIALNHAGEDTESAEEWLLDKARTPNDLIWFIQEDSEGETECNIQYQSNDYNINILENKKIENSNIGSCLTRAQSNFWLEISSSCYDEEFKITCDKNFIATLLYKNQNSPTIYVLEGTEKATGLSGTISLQVSSKCLGSSSCEYESTVWGALALLETGHEIDDFIPYIVAMAETNKRYLPNSFTYAITDYEDYATKLIQQQSTGFYWLADSSAYNKVYDTSLALLSLTSSSSELVSKAKDWLIFSQGSNGCWQNSVRDSAIALWALSGRAGRSSGGGTTTFCSEANFFCIPTLDCPTGEQLNNYYCSGSGKVCCRNENLLSCSEYGGETCSSGLVCTGNEKRASDTGSCCVGECVERRDTLSECEDLGYSCRASCSSNQEEIDYSCNGNGFCCRTKISQGGGLGWFVWLLIILILITLGVLGWIYREKLRVLWFKIKTKFKRDRKGGAKNSSRKGPGLPPKPGFPPIRRPVPMRNPRRSYDRRDKEMSETFRKLREMSG